MGKDVVKKLAASMISFFLFADKMFAHIVAVLLIISLLTMLGLVFYQVVLRNLFNSGLVWGDVAARNLVIWIAFLGASLATRNRQHISVDFLTRLLPRSPREVLRFIFDGLACFVSLMLALAALKFVEDEHMMGSVTFLNIPSWAVQAIIPSGFALISFQYAIGMALDIYRLWTKRGRAG